jgi:putative component of toxin-antitoxin plasmid stabilization module
MVPSDIAWWMWLLIAAGFGLVAAIAGGVFEMREKRGVGISGPVYFVSAMAGALCMIVGVIRFVKWVWAG